MITDSPYTYTFNLPLFSVESPVITIFLAVLAIFLAYWVGKMFISVWTGA